jgi:hypothetical protein
MSTSLKLGASSEILLATLGPLETGPLDVRVRIVANIQVSAEVARRRVSVFAGDHIADLLRGESPILVISETGAYWRVPVALSSRSWGRIGQVGTIDVDVETGELCVNDEIIVEIERNAGRFAQSAAL